MVLPGQPGQGQLSEQACLLLLSKQVDDTDDRRSGAPAIWGKVKNIQVKRDVLIDMNNSILINM